MFSLGKNQKVLFGIIFSLGIFLRLYHLGTHSFWLDEMATWYYSANSSFSAWFQRYFHSFEPFPGTYYFFNYVWSSLFGTGELAYRLPSAVAGIAAIPALFYLGRSLGGNSTGLLAAGITAVTFRPIYLSQDARPYALLFLFSALYGLALTETLKKNDGKGNQILFVVSAVALTQLHYLGFFLFGLGLGFLLLFSLLEKKIPPRVFWVSLAASFILFVPWIVRMVSHLGYSPANANIRPRSFYQMARAFFKYSFFTDEMPTHLITFAVYFGLLGLLALAIGYAFRSRKKELLFLVGWMVLPLLALWVKSEISQPVYRPRYLAISLPAMIAAAALSVSLLFGSRPRTHFFVGLFLCLVLGWHTVWEAPIHEQFESRRMRQTFSALSTRAESGEQFSLFVCTPRSVYFTYYAERFPALKSHWNGREDCASFPKDAPLALVFSNKSPPNDFEEGMAKTGWRLEQREKWFDHDFYFFRPNP